MGSTVDHPAGHELASLRDPLQDPLLGPRLNLGATDTPLERLDRLGAAIGSSCPRLWMKRDDLTRRTLGGNKLRKLELLLWDAQAASATAVGTIGGPTSNHLRLTAGAALSLGLKAYACVLGNADVEQGGNLTLLQILGATIINIPAEGGVRAQGERARAEFEARVAAEGGRPFWIHFGGESPRGDLAYVGCAREIVDQLGHGPRATFVAVGTGGTVAGLAAGMALLAPQTEVVGYAVSPKGAQVFAGLPSVTAQIARVRSHLAERGHSPAESRFRFEHGQVGAGYAEPTRAAEEAIALLARTEGLFVDPVYTGKALAGMVAEIRAGRFAPDDDVVFVHTGGWPGIFFRRA